MNEARIPPRPITFTRALLARTRHVVLVLAVCASVPAWAGYLDNPDAQALVENMVSEHGFEREQVRSLLADAEHQEAIIKAMNRPAEAMPWYRYRAIFIKPNRIQGGVDFMRTHADLLQAAQERYGVPPTVITAIIGVETLYGRYTGDYRVLDALATLAFDYPPRSAFFRSELEQFLLLGREAHIDLGTVQGSYAGAMGLPQFIASSYRHYAVDFNHNGRTDLWQEPADVIGSVANYLAENGWRRGKPVAFPAVVTAAPAKTLTPSRLDPDYTAGELARAGVKIDAAMPAEMAAGLLVFENENGKEYWVGAHNFFVITTYNHSPLYAMAVHQLSEAIGSAAQDARDA